MLRHGIFPRKKTSCKLVREARLDEASASRVLLSYENQFSPASHQWVVVCVSIEKRPFKPISTTSGISKTGSFLASGPTLLTPRLPISMPLEYQTRSRSQLFDLKNFVSNRYFLVAVASAYLMIKRL